MTYTIKMFSAEDMPHFESLMDRVWASVKGPVLVEIEPVRQRRSLSQNALFHKWCGEVAAQVNKVNTGKNLPQLDTEDMKDFWVISCYGHSIRIIGDVQVTRPRPTHKMDKGEMSHLMQWIEAWCAEKGFKITIPHDCEYRRATSEPV